MKKARLIRVISRFTVALVGLLCLLLVLALIIRTDEVVEARGRLVSETVYPVRAPSDGYVDRVKVREGSPVERGEPLAWLINEALSNQISEMRLTLLQLEKSRDEAAEKIRYLKDSVHPNEQVNTELSMNKTRLSLEAANADKEAQIAEAARMATLLKQDLVSRREHDRVQLQARLAEVREREQKQNLAQLEHELRSIPGRHAEELRHAEHELAQSRIEIEKTRLGIAQMEKKQSLSAILAPAQGIILLGQESEKLVGQYFRTGDRVADLVDSESVLFNALIPENEIRKVRVGQVVNLEISALPYQKFKVFKGRLNEISQESETDKATGASVYQAKIKLEDPWVQIDESAQKEKFFLRPGFTGMARIIVRPDVSFMKWIGKQIFGDSV